MQRGVTVYLVKRDSNGKVDELCLGMKKVRYAKGKWNGFGGKVEKGESIKKAAIREVLEECKVNVEENNLLQMAEITYTEPAGNWKVYAFVCDKWDGEPRETEEMRPKWFSVNNIPYQNMWENDKLWMERILNGEKLKGKVIHDDEDRVVKQEFVSIKTITQ